MMRTAIRLLPILFAALLAACASRAPDIDSLRLYVDGTIWMEHGSGEDLFLRTSTDADAYDVAVYRDGQLSGPEVLNESERKRLPLTGTRTRLHSHPDLPDWRERHARLRSLATDPRATAGAFADAAAGLPMRNLVSDQVAPFTENRPARAAALLDRVDDLALTTETGETLVRRALQADGLDDARLAVWAASRRLADLDEAAQALAESSNAGSETSRVLLEALDEYTGSERAAVYRAASARLVSDPARAGLLARGLSELYGDDRSEAALALLRRDDASAAFNEQLLLELDEFYGDDRVAVYRLAATRVVDRSTAAGLLVRRLEDLYGDDRREAAVALLRHPRASEALAGGVARVLDEFHGEDRSVVFDAIFASPGFTGRAQIETVRAAERWFSGSRRDAARDSLAAHAALSDEARALLRSYRTP